MRVTFLESSHGIRLTKTVTPTETKSYPDVKMVTSTEHQIPDDATWHVEFAKLLEQHGKLGHCLMKGPLKSPAVNESRAGLGDKIAYSDLLVLDFDSLKLPPGPGIKTPISSQDIERISDTILYYLGPEFRNVSYVAQASSSLGRKPDHVSLHIFIRLSLALPPKTIKLWLKNINQTISLFKDQVSLSATGQSLKYPLDPSVADNTKLIFISPPDFTDPTLDPFKTPEDRIAVVTRGAHTLDLAALVSHLNPELVFNEGNELKETLRERAGLKKRQPKMTTINMNGENLELLTNPDRMSISIVNEELPYIRCNINNGDSGAYYFNVNDPTYMYNFKDEPIFEIALADQDFHASIFEKYKNNPDGTGRVRPLQPIVLRDFATDTLYNGLYDPNKFRFSDEYPLTITSQGAIEGFMRSHGQAVPGFIPEAKIVFDPPHGDRKPDLEKIPYYVNLYRPTPIQDNAIVPATPLGYDTAGTLASTCPKIATLVKHMLGDGETEFRHFINWLAFIYQTRTKSMTAWVLGGVPGTGKGAFVNKVLRPLFGDQHVTMKSLENIEEQFNNFMRTAMFVVVDEFQMAATKGGYTGATRMADKLKNQITEPTLTIRSMRSNQIELPSYTNFIFLTNRPDAVRIEPGDRRYNVCPRQERKLIEVHPDIVNSFDSEVGNISEELAAFAGILETFKVDKQAARTCLVNEAKEVMKNVSMSVFDDFCNSFTTGSFESLSSVMDIEITDTFNANRIQTAQRFVKLWLSEAFLNKPSIILSEHMRVVYHVMNEGQPPMSARQFAKMLTRAGLPSKSHRVNGEVIRGIEVKWAQNKALKETVETYLPPQDQALLKQKSAR